LTNFGAENVRNSHEITQTNRAHKLVYKGNILTLICACIWSGCRSYRLFLGTDALEWRADIQLSLLICERHLYGTSA